MTSVERFDIDGEGLRGRAILGSDEQGDVVVTRVERRAPR